MSTPKPYGLISASENYDLESQVEVYGAEWANADGWRLDDGTEVYGVILSKEEIPTPTGVHGDSILLESGDYILLESGTTDVLLKEAA